MPVGALGAKQGAWDVVIPLKSSQLNSAESIRQSPELMLSAAWSLQQTKINSHLLIPGEMETHHCSLCLLLAASDSRVLCVQWDRPPGAEAT